MPEGSYRGRDAQPMVFGPPRIHLPFASVNKAGRGLTSLDPEQLSTCRSWSGFKGEKLGECSLKRIRLFYVRRVPAVGEDLLVVATTTRRVLVEDGADLGDHRLGWVDLFPWPIRHHTDFSEVGEICS
jgi:hypothetical protein